MDVSTSLSVLMHILPAKYHTLISHACII
uniref:Uncharacterized protein n=1 Tax=Heterorhabditis bacteriophora TaxID=37862 RepID=A0A1I7X3V9_HETBA